MAIRELDYKIPTPGWGAKGAEPSPEFKKKGYVAGYKPPAGFFNWFWKRVSDNVSEIQELTKGYAATNEGDKDIITQRINTGNAVHDEITQHATAREINIEGVADWDDLLNVPIHIRSAAVGTAMAVTLRVNSLPAKPIHFPRPDNGNLTDLPPKSWSKQGSVYIVVWNGTSLVCLNPCMVTASTNNPGIVQLSNSITSASETQAATSAAVKNLADIVSVIEQNTLKRLFPVGSTYSSFNNVDPSVVLGFGTWKSAFVGRSPIGVDPDDPDFDTSGKTGGAKSVILTAATIPAHVHKTPELNGKAIDNGEHEHEFSNAQTDASRKHSHFVPDHRHVIPVLNGSTTTGGEHFHKTKIQRLAFTDYKMTSPQDGQALGFFSTENHGTAIHSSRGEHEHLFSTRESKTGFAGAVHTYENGNHMHNVTGKAASAGSHEHDVTIAPSATEPTGSGGAHNNMHPYETMYFWRRTA